MHVHIRHTRSKGGWFTNFSSPGKDILASGVRRALVYTPDYVMFNQHIRIIIRGSVWLNAIFSAYMYYSATI